MKTRVISGIILIAVMFILMMLGGDVLWLSLTVVSLVGVFELYRVMKIEKTGMGALGYVGVLAWWAMVVRLNMMQVAVPILVVLLILELAMFVFSYPKYQAEQLFASLFGVIYVAIMLSFLYLVREDVEHGKWLVWLVLIASWGSDTFAYFVGVLFGRHKLAPVLSPKKSIEGSVGGVLGAALLGAVFGLVLGYFVEIPSSAPVIFAVIGGVGSIVSQIGDLAASGIKRCFQVKDYGTLIPGHGGILDRFDSVIITAPIVYYLAVIMMTL